MPQKSLTAAETDFLQTIGRLVRRARAAAASNDLSWSETAVLKRLAESGRATTADLARAQGMRPQSMRTIVASLEKLGMVRRKPHATDGRQVHLQLTAKGAATQRSAGEAKRTWVSHTFARLAPRERKTLLAAGKILSRALDSEPQ